MDPLSLTASTIAVATLAWQSCKVAYNLVDGFAKAPQAIARSKTSLYETQKTVSALQQMLINSDSAAVCESVLETVQLKKTLMSTQRLCDEIAATITGFTSHSTDTKFSKRDRLAVNFHESKINDINRDLDDCQRTMSSALVSIDLIVTIQTADDVERLSNRFQAQEQALASLDAQLQNRDPLPTSEEGSAERDASLQLTAELRKLCLQAHSATAAKRTGQKFGDAMIDQSRVFQGIAGESKSDEEQSFGNLTASNNSTVGQGRMDAVSFAVLFGGR